MPRPSPGRQFPPDAALRVLLIVAAFAPFLGTLFYGYVYDDTGIILHNPVINGWGALARVWTQPYWSNGGADYAGLYRPLLMAIFAAIWNGFHGFAIAFHLVVVSLHATATVLLWRVLRRGVDRWTAAGAALWFAVHPVHVEAVANIANSSEVLVGVWTALLVLVLLPTPSWGRTEAVHSPIPTAPDLSRALIAALLYAAALLTKESGAVAPALAVIAMWGWRYPIPEPRAPSPKARPSWLPVLGLWTIAAISVALARRAVLGGFVAGTPIAAPGLDGLSASQRVWAMLSLGGRVAGLMLWPTVQNPHYGPSVVPRTVGPTAAAAVTVVVIVVVLIASLWLAFRASSRDRRPLVAIAWCLIAFLPASNLLTPTGQVLAERTLYVSSMGMAMLLAWSMDRLLALARSPRGVPGSLLVSRAIAVATVVALCAACIRGFIRTQSYARVWRSHRDLFAQMIRADSLDYRGYQFLAIENDKTGHNANADRLYARAYALDSTNRTLLADYGEYLLHRQQPARALEVGQRLFGYDDMRTNGRAVTLYLDAITGAWGLDSTLAASRRLTQRSPSARSYLFVGLALEAKGDTAGARAAYAAGLRLAPSDSALTARAVMLQSNHGARRASSSF